MAGDVGFCLMPEPDATRKPLPGQFCEPFHTPPATAILAGGLATRLGSVSAYTPKSMLLVGGQPFIAHQLEQLSAQGLPEVVICAGNLADQIESFVGNGAKFGCKVRYSFDGQSRMGTGGALRLALPLLGEHFVVMYGDSYLQQPIPPVWEAFLQAKKAALMTVFENRNRWDRSNIEWRDGSIVRYEKSASTLPDTQAAMQHIDYGLGCIRSSSLAAWPENSPFDLGAYYRAMLEKEELAGFEVQERFYEIGSPAGLAETDKLLSFRGARK